ncbi:hypothetical protein Zmor_020984 [Zophobas morio]|uniref:Uncharacterized protein n=1 Tax=Zophobas morio TaxID=2755281 RepID=A0AA38I502_9CUCU|nr:hypothetical protein Zmor_020984 [Zophobas morio]
MRTSTRNFLCISHLPFPTIRSVAVVNQMLLFVVDSEYFAQKLVAKLLVRAPAPKPPKCRHQHQLPKMGPPGPNCRSCSSERDKSPMSLWRAPGACYNTVRRVRKPVPRRWKHWIIKAVSTGKCWGVLINKALWVLRFFILWWANRSNVATP